ncbi:MAG: hypothetical protein Q4G40_10125, partial [Brachybacterium sp.]|nr:hypothetical protein [Brachybacterium sp.]
MAPVSTLLPHRVYSRQALLALGIAERRFSDGSLIRVLPGCYTRADCPAPLQEIARALQRAIAPQTVISHLTAATLFGLPLPAQVETRAREGPLHGRVPPGTDRRRSAQLDLHRMKPGPTVLHGGLSLSHPVEVCREISSLLDDTDLVVCLDALAGRWG